MYSETSLEWDERSAVNVRQTVYILNGASIPSTEANIWI